MIKFDKNIKRTTVSYFFQYTANQHIGLHFQKMAWGSPKFKGTGLKYDPIYSVNSYTVGAAS